MPLEEASSARAHQDQNLHAEIPARLAIFPTETLELIFSNFCLHCCHTSSPNADADISSLPDAYSGGQHKQNSDEPSWYSLNRHALFSLCLVSRRFRDIAQPIMYHEFALGAGDSWRSTRYAWEGRLPCFLRTVAERRDLACFVRRACVHPFLLDKWCVVVDGEVDQANAVAVNSALHHCARLLGIEPGHYLGQFPSPSPFPATTDMLRMMSSQLLGLVIAAVPNMEHLSLQSSRPSVRISAAALEVAGFTGLRLKTLRVSSRPSASPESRRMFNVYDEAIGVLQKAPGLSTLDLHLCGSIGYIPSLRNLRVLRITQSRLRRGDLVAMLSVSTQLDTFFYEEAYAGLFRGRRCRTIPPSENTDTYFRPSDVINFLGLPSNDLLSLHIQNETLKSLHLDFRNRSISTLILDAAQPTPSLKGFKALEHLFLNIDTIFSTRYDGGEPLATGRLTQLLPATIVTLRLAGMITVRSLRPRLTMALLGLAQAASEGVFAHLREVSCDAREKSSAGDGEKDAAKLFEHAGVHFGYKDWPLSKVTLEDNDV